MGRRFAQGAGEIGPWRRHVDGLHESWLEPHLTAREDLRVLKTDSFDEACGGGLAPLLRRCARSAVVIDVALGTLCAASRKPAHLEPVAADVRELPFAEGSFDLVVSNSTLDHFDGVNAIECALHELHRVLRPGGSLFLTFDNPQHPLVALRNALPVRWREHSRLVPYYVGPTLGRAALARALERAGFDVIEMRALLHAPRVIAIPFLHLAARALPRPWIEKLHRGLRGFEALERLPTRYRTGHFVAAQALRR